MPDPTRAGRAPLRLVDPDVPEPGDPFAAPTFAFRNGGRPARPVAPPAVPALVDGGAGSGPDCPDDWALLMSLPDDPALLDWPSRAWNEHLAVCERPRRCPHVDDVPLPRWWVARMNARMPMHEDPAEAIAMAMRRINAYKGGKHVTPEGAAFARDATRDALPAAQQPVSRSWVTQSLACLGGLATWVHNEGEPLTREHVFDPNTRLRYLEGPSGPVHLDKYSRRNYRLRYHKLAAMLLGSQREVITGRKPVGKSDAILPLTRQEEADLWVWSQGLRPATVRKRIQGMLAAGLGVGARRRDFPTIQRHNVTRDAAGVHVVLPETVGTRNKVLPARTVTCSADWEDRLWTLSQSMPDDHYLAAPWRDTQPDGRTIDATMRLVNRDQSALPPVEFSTESLRNTWLLRHIEAGTPVPLLMKQGGLLSTASIEKLVPYTTPAAPDEAAAWMRRAAGPVEQGDA